MQKCSRCDEAHPSSRHPAINTVYCRSSCSFLRKKVQFGAQPYERMMPDADKTWTINISQANLTTVTSYWIRCAQIKTAKCSQHCR